MSELTDFFKNYEDGYEIYYFRKHDKDHILIRLHNTSTKTAFKAIAHIIPLRDDQSWSFEDENVHRMFMGIWNQCKRDPSIYETVTGRDSVFEFKK